ncbi:hypothetical protein [Albidovulum sediminis]|uniref:DUF2946 domain-containing protein n=1 Tax=Albidovulum sediminis TaxID=3066345 RepID=A0ABT2NK65_9RHOB|nr:hypothetical protein [Defluviimonas sediminis]MCT8329306.1 hypothetical protein [Defluviimonas sediminis]
MAHLLRSVISGVVLRPVLVLALAMAGLARPVPDAALSALQSFALAGGDIAAICGDADGDGRADHDGCPACHVAGAALLPDAARSPADADLRIGGPATAPCVIVASAGPIDPAHRLRAPPAA